VFLGSKGIMQLGWATVRCRFTNEVHNNLIFISLNEYLV